MRSGSARVLTSSTTFSEPASNFLRTMQFSKHGRLRSVWVARKVHKRADTYVMHNQLVCGTFDTSFCLCCSLRDLVSYQKVFAQAMLQSSIYMLTCVCVWTAFVEFEDTRDADDAVRSLDGTAPLQ